MNDSEFTALLEKAPLNLNIQKYLMVTRLKLRQYRRIVVSYSGGSDSDIVLDILELVKPEGCGEIKYVFFDTGLEWDATYRHIAEVEEKYGVQIERRKAKVSIPAACKKHGVPFMTKVNSEMIGRLQRHEFDWKDQTLEDALEKYPKATSGIKWFLDGYETKDGKKSKFTAAKHKLLKEFMIENPPGFAISDKCCDYAKKNVAYDFDKEFQPDLKVTGMRQAEGGRRIGQIKNCFTPSGENKDYADYRPLWFWSDEDKQIYKEWRGITYSDCYEVWGFSRTGCVGCPCASASVSQLEQAKQYEPNKVKAAYVVFGKSYEYREKYNEFKNKKEERQ
jgi:3'-phosphoadenosine 5'-phosphosulfate sulfotransferase (PAPS reductase)/FAD synthetase